MFNEREVVSRILQEDLGAFELLVRQYEQLVLHVTSRLVDRQADKEDICQEVFIKVYQSLRHFRFESKLSTWIARIAYLTAVNHVKKFKGNRQIDFRTDPVQFQFSDDDPERGLERKDMAVYLNRLIAQMPLPYRTVLTLYHLDEFSCKEIGDITGTPENTIKSHLFRARKLLKEKIENDNEKTP